MKNEASTPGEDSAHNSGTTPAAKSSPATGGTAASRTPETSVGATGTRSVKRTRTAGAWIGLVVGALILILLLVFILQNGTSTTINMLFWSFDLPLGVSMLFAAIAGALIMALVGGARILQLRKAYRRKPPRP